MVSPIYRIHKRGQVVNYACQWLWEHRRLAFRVMVMPVLLLYTLALTSIFFLESTSLLVLTIIVALLIVPVLPNFMFEVVENPEQYGYPQEKTSFRQLLSVWWHYFWPVLKGSIFSFFIMFFASFTVFGGFLIEPVLPLMIAMMQRDETVGWQSIVISLRLVLNSFGNFCLCVLGGLIINISLIGAPYFFIMGIGEFLQHFVSNGLYQTISDAMNGDTFEMLGIIFMVLGAIFATMVTTIIVHFFYGNCVEKEDHPELIDRMKGFSEIKK